MNNRESVDKVHDRRGVVVACATWLARLLLGGTFIFSGFVKGVDPWGTLYKFEEYVAAMGMPVSHNLLLVGVFALCAIEFLIGIFLILGCYRRSAPVMALAFMCVMLPLTFWIAVSDPVADCGCFGEFLVISNWATFWKNVVLTALAAWLLIYNRKCITIISPAFQWIAAVLSFIYILVISLVGYTVQPMLDFRPYKIGSPLLAQEEDESDDFTFVYRKGDTYKEFGVDDDLPSEEDGWTFVERRENKKPEVSADGEKTFRIWDRGGDEDLSEEILGGTGSTVMLLIPDMSEVSPATTYKINALERWSKRHGATMVAVVSGTSEQISEWEDMSLPDYETYTADDTAIKELARGNPAVVSMKDGVIEWKSTLGSLYQEEKDEKVDFTPSKYATEAESTLLKLTGIYLLFMAFPLILTILPRITTRDGRVRRGESSSPDIPAPRKRDEPSHD